MTDIRDPEITIVMPVRNEAAAIDATLDAVLGQDVGEPYEVLVAEGASTDATREIVERRAAVDSRVRVVDNPSGLIPTGLNRALAVARGRYLIRIDGHSKPSDDYVRRLIAHLRSGECEGAGGRKRAVGVGKFGCAVAAAHGSRFGIGDSKYHYSDKREFVDHVPFGAYRLDLARAIGGWDETLLRNQDYEFDYRYTRAGGRLLLEPSIVIDWNVRETPRALARQYFDYGFWRMRTLLRHPTSFHLRWLAPPALVLAVVTGLLASPTAPGRVLLVASAGAYGTFLLAGAVNLARRVGPRLIPGLIAALAIMHVFWGSGMLASALTAGLERLFRRDEPQPDSATRT